MSKNAMSKNQCSKYFEGDGTNEAAIGIDMTMQTQISSKAKSLRSIRAPRRSRVADMIETEGLTVEQWDALPDTKPRYELIDGRLVQKMTTKRKHSQAAGELLFALKMWGRERGWQFFPEGTGVAIAPRRAYVPDVIGFEPGVVLNPDESVGGTPFLVAEVLSDSTSRRDRTDKARDYARLGVALYLIIDPEARTLEVFRLTGRRYAAPEMFAHDAVWQPVELPEFGLEVARLWM